MSSPDPEEDRLPQTNKFAGEAFGPPNVRTVYAGAEDDNVTRPSRVLLLIGPSGAGKSSLIDFMCNYFYGATLDDEERYKIANEKFDGTTPDKSIITYIFNVSKLDFRPVIVDTPGCGDTEINKDITKLLPMWLEENSNMRIDAVCVVLPAFHRLTSTDDKFLMKTLELFPPSVKKNMVVIMTGSDGSPVNNGLLRRFQLHECSVFKVNNTCLYKRKQEDALKEHLRGNYWKMTEKNFDALFEKVKQFQPCTISGKPHEELTFGGILSNDISKTVTTIVSKACPSSLVDATSSITDVIKKPLNPMSFNKPRSTVDHFEIQSQSGEGTHRSVADEKRSSGVSNERTRSSESMSDDNSPCVPKRRSFSSSRASKVKEICDLKESSSNSSIINVSHSVIDQSTDLHKTKSVAYNEETFGTVNVHTTSTDSIVNPINSLQDDKKSRASSPPQTNFKNLAKEPIKEGDPTLSSGLITNFRSNLLNEIKRTKHAESSQISSDYSSSFCDGRSIDEYIASRTNDRNFPISTSNTGIYESEILAHPARSETLISDSSQSTVINCMLNDTTRQHLSSDICRQTESSMIDGRGAPSLNEPPKACSEVRVEDRPHGQIVTRTSTVPLRNGYTKTISTTLSTHSYGANDESFKQSKEYLDRYSRISDMTTLSAQLATNPRNSEVYAYGTVPRVYDSSRVKLMEMDNKESVTFSHSPKESCVDASPPPITSPNKYRQHRKSLNETLIDDPAFGVEVRNRVPEAVDLYERNGQSWMFSQNMHETPPREEQKHQPSTTTIAGVSQMDEHHQYDQQYHNHALPGYTTIGTGAQSKDGIYEQAESRAKTRVTGTPTHGHTESAHMHENDPELGNSTTHHSDRDHRKVYVFNQPSKTYQLVQETKYQQSQHGNRIGHGSGQDDQEKVGGYVETSYVHDNNQRTFDHHQATSPQKPVMVPRIIDQNTAAMANSAGAEGVYKPSTTELSENGQRVSQMYSQINKAPLVPSHGSRYQNLPLTGLTESASDTTTNIIHMRDKSTRNRNHSAEGLGEVSEEMRRRENLLQQTREDVQRESYIERMAPNVHKRQPKPTPRYDITPDYQSMSTSTRTTEAPNNYIIPLEMRQSKSPITYRVHLGQKFSSQDQLNKWGNQIPPYHQRYPDPTQDPKYQKQRNLAEHESDDWDTESESPNKVQQLGYVEKTTTRNQYNNSADGKKSPALNGSMKLEHIGPKSDPRSPLKGEFERSYRTTPLRPHASTEDRAYLVELQPLPRDLEKKKRRKKHDPQRVTNRRWKCLPWDPCSCRNPRDCFLNILCFVIAPLFVFFTIIAIIVVAVI